ncbi:MAG: hypothetical protein ACRCXB_26015 [Aeromonadaceae bacterium]
MDYFELAISSLIIVAFVTLGVKAFRGTYSYDSNTREGRFYLCTLLFYVAVDNVKPFAEALHKILGGN